MLFNSFEFFLFLPTVFILYWFVFSKNLRFQNLLILLSSYVFYGWWDYRFLSLILLSTIVDYFVGLRIPQQKSNKRKTLFLFLSIFFNLFILGFFKYYNFFIDSWIDLLGAFGYKVKSVWTLNIILPVGISFYTFQTMSYTIDIYRNKLKPTYDFISFAAFVSFFPQLVAGPIERASNLLPQITEKRKFKHEQAVQGLRLILWGMFKKIFIADNLAPMVDNIFSNYLDFSGGVLCLGLIYFSIQIYCDFSGYSDIAIGTSKLFGFELISNFRFPYFSRNIGEFWRRWHVSLSSWFRDYLYIPMGGSKKGTMKSIRNIFIIFFVSGLWHGANWTFIFWGLFHSLLFIPSFLINTNRKFKDSVFAENTLLPTLKESLQVITTFLLVSIGWVFFRSETLTNSFSYLYQMFFKIDVPSSMRFGLIYVLLLLFLDYTIRHNERKIFNYSFVLRHFLYLIISILVIFSLFNESNKEFIYFQF